MAQTNPTSIKLYAYISAAWVELNTLGPGRGRWGMGDNLPTTRIADPGEFEINLDNSGGIYTPDGPSALAGWKKGIQAKMVITYDSVDHSFFYKITDIKINPKKSDQSVSITLRDWLEDAVQYPIINPQLLEDAAADSAITSLIADMPLQPQSTSLDEGLYTFPTVFDTVRDNTKAYSELAKLALSETGYAYLQRDGVLTFESADHRNGAATLTPVPLAGVDSGFLLKEDGDDLLKEDGGKIILNQTETVLFENNSIDINITYGENLINRWTTKAYPKRIDDESVRLYQSEAPIPLNSGETKTFRGFFTNPTSQQRINAVPPEQQYTSTFLRFEGDTENSDVVDDMGNTWTNSGIALVSNVKKFGNRSGYFDGSGSWISTPDKAAWDFGADDFTIRWWEYRFDANSGECVASRDYSDAIPAWIVGQSDGTNSKCYFSTNGTSWDIANGKTFGAITLNTWVHYAITRSGSNWYMFKNGTVTDSWTSAGTVFPMSSVLSLGRNVAAYITACIDGFEILTGYAAYTAAFTAPTTSTQLEGTFSSMWTTDTFSGTDLSDDLDLTVAYGTEGALYTIQNTGATKGYAYLTTYGFGIYSDSPIENTQEDNDSINEYGYSNANINQQYQYELHSAILEGSKQLELNKQPRTTLNSVSLCANSSSSHMMAFLYTDVGSLVRIKEDALGVDGYYYIQGVEFEIQGLIIMFKWILKQHFSLAKGLTQMAVEFRGGVTADGINFGYLPQVSQDRISHRAFSAWVYLDGAVTAAASTVIGQHSDNGGAWVGFVKNGSDMQLYYYNSLYAGAGVGAWYDDTAIGTGGWHHIFISQDTSPTPTTDPIMYIDGSLRTITEASTPTGSLDSDDGNPVTLGNLKTASLDYPYPFDGKIKDARIYDMDAQDLTPAQLAAALYAEGANGTAYYDGMVFQAFAVRTEDVTAYTDLTLTSSDKVLDAYLGMVGTPNGSPITRTI